MISFPRKFQAIEQSVLTPFPALLIHGGGFCTGAKEHIPSNQIETLLELGFVVVSVNYRLCPTISLYDGPLTDCKDCYAWCKTSLPSLLKKDTGISIDPRRLVTMGHSAGGTLALLMVSPHPSDPSNPHEGGKTVQCIRLTPFI
jgi:acetyl esterase/lipase